MDIVIAAEKSSIAEVLSSRLHRRILESDIKVRDNPEETGSFFVDWRFRRFVVAPNGEVEPA